MPQLLWMNQFGKISVCLKSFDIFSEHIILGLKLMEWFSTCGTFPSLHLLPGFWFPFPVLPCSNVWSHLFETSADNTSWESVWPGPVIRSYSVVPPLSVTEPYICVSFCFFEWFNIDLCWRRILLLCLTCSNWNIIVSNGTSRLHMNQTGSKVREKMRNMTKGDKVFTECILKSVCAEVKGSQRLA